MRNTLTLVVAVAALTGCFSADPPDGAFVCGPAARPCPEGYRCASDHTCRRGTSPQDLGGSTDLSASADLSGVDLGPPDLSGPPMLGVSPSAQDFGKVAIGKSASHDFVFINGGSPSTGTLTTTMSGDPSFTLASDGCHGQPLAAGASCTITVTFAPTTTGTDSFMLAVSGTPGGTAMATAMGEGGNFVTLTVTKSGATGSVSSGTGIDCGTTCSGGFNNGDQVTLTAAPDITSRFDTWSGTGVTCQGSATLGVCTFTITADTTINAAFKTRPQVNIAFTTSTTVMPGALGSLANADGYCRTAAIRGGLPGTYRAFLSTSTMNAKDRLGAASGWVRPDGLVFAVSNTELLQQGKVRYPLVLDETGTPIPTDLTLAGMSVATGSDSTGTYIQGCSCGDYTDSSTTASLAAGVCPAGTEAWVDIASGPGACGKPYHLYCFETTYSGGAPLPSPGPVRTAFVTAQQQVLPLTSLAAADLICQGEGNAHFGTGKTWLALLATTTASAKSRMNTNGYPWARPDGVLLANTAAGLFSDSILAAFNVDSTGTTYVNWSGNANNVAVGADFTNGSQGGLGNPGTTQTCGSWTSTSGVASAGRVNFTTASWYTGVNSACAGGAPTARLYCLQQ